MRSGRATGNRLEAPPCSVPARVGTTRLIDNAPIVFDRITPGLVTAGTAPAASTTSEGNGKD